MIWKKGTDMKEKIKYNLELKMLYFRKPVRWAENSNKKKHNYEQIDQNCKIASDILFFVTGCTYETELQIVWFCFKFGNCFFLDNQIELMILTF